MAIDGRKVMRLRMTIPGLTQNGLSVEIGIGQSIIHRIESGKSINTSTCTAKLIAEYFKVKVDDILSEEDGCCT